MKTRAYSMIEVLAVIAILAVVAQGVIFAVREAMLEHRRFTTDAWTTWQGHLVRHEWQRWSREAPPDAALHLDAGMLVFAYPDRERRLVLPPGSEINRGIEGDLAILTIRWQSHHRQRPRHHHLRLVSHRGGATP